MNIYILLPVGILGVIEGIWGILNYNKDGFVLVFPIIIAFSAYILINAIIAYSMKIELSVSGLIMTHRLLHQYDEVPWTSLPYGYYISYWSKVYLVLSPRELSAKEAKSVARKANMSFRFYYYRIENYIVISTHFADTKKMREILQKVIFQKNYNNYREIYEHYNN